MTYRITPNRDDGCEVCRHWMRIREIGLGLGDGVSEGWSVTIVDHWILKFAELSFCHLNIQKVHGALNPLPARKSTS